MQVSRRAFLLYSATAAASAALPLPLPAAAGEGSAHEYGFTFDDALYETGFPTREAAIEAARLYSGARGFTTARVAYNPMTYPDTLGEKAVDHLINKGRLGNDMADWMICANEEADFEGEFADACNRTDRSGLGDAGRAAIAAALVRAGEPGMAEAVRAGGKPEGELPDPVMDALTTDAALEAELGAALVAWAEANGLEHEMRGLATSEVEAHPAPVAVLAA